MSARQALFGRSCFISHHSGPSQKIQYSLFNTTPCAHDLHLRRPRSFLSSPTSSSYVARGYKACSKKLGRSASPRRCCPERYPRPRPVSYQPTILIKIELGLENRMKKRGLTLAITARLHFVFSSCPTTYRSAIAYPTVPIVTAQKILGRTPMGLA